MTFVFVPPPAPSARAQRLATKLSAAVDEFRTQEPGVTGAEVRQALQLAAASSGANKPAALIAVALGLVVLLLGGLLFFLRSSGGELELPVPFLFLPLGAILLVGVVLGLSRRS